jgi:hypothetical protein
MTKAFICPYCFNEIKAGDLEFICSECDTAIKEKDLSVTERSLKTKIKCRNDECACQNVTKRRCPYDSCNHTIADALIHTKTTSFSLLGSTGAGKTNCITVMLTELSKRNKNLNLALTPITAECRQKFELNKAQVYENRVKLDQTATGTEQVDIFSVKNLKSNDILTFNIYDGAGESITSANSSDPYSELTLRYIEYSESMMFLIDPLRFPTLRRQISDEDVQSSIADEGENAISIINSIAEMYKNRNRIKYSQKIDKFVAIVLTKMDLFKEHFDERGLLFSRNSTHPQLGYFNMEDCREIDRELTDWLIENDQEDFIRSLKEHFYFDKKGFKEKKCFLFGISAFGKKPDIEGALPEIHPHRVLDPLLWLMAKQGFIDSREGMK